MNDSRKDDRLNVALIMRYREPTMLEPREGQCQNLSLSGMCILTPKPSPRGALIRFECVSGGAAEGIRGTARVVWQRSKTDPRGASAMGVRFVRLEAGCREALEGLLAALGGEGRPASFELPRAPGAGDATARELENGRAGDTVVNSPVAGSGVTQQGMGGARSRSLHYPTLRGIGLPSSTRARPRNGSSSVPPEQDGRDSEEAGSRRANSPRPGALGMTLPGHATTSSAPLSATPSAPPDPAEGTRGHDGLDRTRRGMPPFSSPPATDAAADAEFVEAPRSNSDRPAAGERTSDRPPRPGSVDDLRGSPPPPGPDVTDDPESPSDAAWERPSGTTEPTDEVAAARRRAARAAAVSGAVPALPDPSAARSKNWVPWIVIGTGLLASWVMITIFGSGPAGVPVDVNLDAKNGDQAKSTGPGERTAPGNAPATAGMPAATTSPAVLRTGVYVLEVASEPAGARITAADQLVLAPAVMELATVTGPITVKAELDGHETVTTTVNPTDFVAKDGRNIHSLVLKLPAAGTSPAPTEADRSAASTAKTGPPPKQSDAARATSTKPGETKAKPPRRTPTPRVAAGVSEAPSVTPQIAPPPVPIESAASSSGASAESKSATPTTPPPARSGGEVTTPEGSLLDGALDCLSRGDNLCVISTLEGRARTARELEVLIETHLALGNAVDAERSMHRYLDRFPDGKGAAKYERWLKRRSEPAGAAP